MSTRIRKPGETFDLTDEEILSSPARLLNREQRKRRRALKAARSKARIDQLSTHAHFLQCAGYTKKGKPCSRYAVRGAKHCTVHLNDAEKAKLGVERPAEARKRLRQTELGGQKVTGPQMARMTFEVALEKLLNRYFHAVGMEFVGFDETGAPVIYDNGAEKGLCLYGESKDGDINVTDYPDLAAQIQVIEKLYDRIYGKPKQTQVLEGGVKPVKIQPVKNAERAQDVLTLLHRTGAFGPHEGRRRTQPAETHTPEGTPKPKENVVPLRPGGDDEE